MHPAHDGEILMTNWNRRGVFDLRIWLIVASLLLIAAIHAGLAQILTRSVTSRILQREGDVAQEFLDGVIAAENGGDHLFDTPAPSPALTSFAAHVQSLPGTARANIYSLDGFIRYSSEKNLIGLQFKDNEELLESAKGLLITSLEAVSDSDKPEHLAMNRFTGEELIEAYIPVKDASGKVVAVVEFYREPTMVKETLADITRVIWLAAALSGLILIAAAGLMMALAKRQIVASK